MKMRQSRNGLTRAEFRQRDIDEEVVKRVDEILAKVAKKKEETKSKEEKIKWE